MRYLCFLVLISLFQCYGKTLTTTDNKIERDAYAHPRLFFNSEELLDAKERISRKPWSTYWEIHSNTLKYLEANDSSSETSKGLREIFQISHYSMEAVFLNDTESANIAYKLIERFEDHESFMNEGHQSIGLKRAELLKNMAIAYDLCWTLWSDNQITKVNNILWNYIQIVSIDMGHTANYAIESNWMGARYSSLLLAALAWDDLQKNSLKKTKNIPILWSSRERLFDHIKANTFSDGWNVESLGYQAYSASFIFPALSAYYRFSKKGTAGVFDHPNLMNTYKAYSISSIPISWLRPSGGFSNCIQPDLSDGNPMGSISWFSFGTTIYPDSISKYLYWMLDKAIGKNYIDTRGLILFYPIIFRKDNLTPKTPDWLSFVDRKQGILLSRNRYNNENDILFCVNASQTPMKGHEGFDRNTWRLIGLGNLWVIGSGRTNDWRGQPNLFSDTTWKSLKLKNLPVPNMTKYIINENNSYTRIEGSIYGVVDHVRESYSYFDTDKYGTPALIVFDEKSQNGKWWRINTPEFNQLSILENGYLLTGLGGQTMRVLFPKSKSIKTVSRKWTIGGNTKRMNFGIRYGNRSYRKSLLIDSEVGNSPLVVITLAEPGMSHPVISYEENEVFINGVRLDIGQ